MLLEYNGLELRNYINSGKNTDIELYSTDEHNVRITKVNLDKIPSQEIITKFNKRHLNEEDIVYFSKSSITPRYKIKDYCENNNINLNKTNRIQYGTTFILNKDELKVKDILKFETYKVVPIENYINHFKINLVNSSKLNLKKYTHVYILKDYGIIRHEERFGQKYINSCPDEEVAFINPKYLSLMTILDLYTSNPEKYSIVFDQTISSKINEYILDPPTFQNLENMFSSSNETDQKLAAEIIANCDRDKYKIEILMLMNKYDNKLRTFTKDSLNLRLLYKHFSSIEFGRNYVEFINSILNKDRELLTDDAKKSLNTFILNKVKDDFQSVRFLNIDDISTTIK